MSGGAKLALGIAGGFLLLNWWLGFWWAMLILIGLPVAGYMMLDSSQKRRLKGLRRKQIGG